MDLNGDERRRIEVNRGRNGSLRTVLESFGESRARAALGEMDHREQRAWEMTAIPSRAREDRRRETPASSVRALSRRVPGRICAAPSPSSRRCRYPVACQGGSLGRRARSCPKVSSPAAVGGLSAGHRWGDSRTCPVAALSSASPCPHGRSTSPRTSVGPPHRSPTDWCPRSAGWLQTKPRMTGSLSPGAHEARGGSFVRKLRCADHTPVPPPRIACAIAECSEASHSLPCRLVLSTGLAPFLFELFHPPLGAGQTPYIMHRVLVAPSHDPLPATPRILPNDKGNLWPLRTPLLNDRRQLLHAASSRLPTRLARGRTQLVLAPKDRQRQVAVVLGIPVQALSLLIPMQRGVGRLQIQPDHLRLPVIVFQEQIHPSRVHLPGSPLNALVAVGSRSFGTPSSKRGRGPEPASLWSPSPRFFPCPFRHSPRAPVNSG